MFISNLAHPTLTFTTRLTAAILALSGMTACGRFGFGADSNRPASDSHAQDTDSEGGDATVLDVQWKTAVGQELRAEWNHREDWEYDAQLLRPGQSEWSKPDEVVPGHAAAYNWDTAGEYRWRVRIRSPKPSDWFESPPQNVWWRSDQYYFSQPSKVEGLTDVDRVCRVTSASGKYNALCTRARSTEETSIPGRLRVYAMHSSDGLSWSQGTSMLSAFPTAYRTAQGTYENGFPEYMTQAPAHLVYRSDGSLLAAGSFYFQWIGADWNYLAATWTSANGSAWSGYDGTSDDRVVRFGHEYAANGAAVVIGLHVTTDQKAVVYLSQSCAKGQCAPTLRRLTSTNTTQWQDDTAFVIDPAERYPAASAFAFYGIDDQHYLLNMIHQPKGACPTAADVVWKLSWSPNGLADSFGKEMPWHVLTDGDAVIDPCLISEPTFVRDGNHVRLYYKLGGAWWTTLSARTL